MNTQQINRPKYYADWLHSSFKVQITNQVIDDIKKNELASLDQNLIPHVKIIKDNAEETDFIIVHKRLIDVLTDVLRNYCHQPESIILSPDTSTEDFMEMKSRFQYLEYANEFLDAMLGGDRCDCDCERNTDETT